jgi:hypothetical protein
MNRFTFEMVTERAKRVVARNADDYAEILVAGDAESASNVEVNCVLTFAGYTPAKFMMAWAHGEFDV